MLFTIVNIIIVLIRILCISSDAEYVEYENLNETLIWCIEDKCVFWSALNDKIIVRRLTQLEKAEVEQLSTLNASAFASAQDTIAGSSSIFSPFGKMPTRSATLRTNR